MKCLLVTLLLLSCLPSGGVCAPESGAGNIRVAIVKGGESVRLDGRGVLLTDLAGESIRLTLPLVIRRHREGITVNGRAMRGLVASAPAAVTVNGKGYRGKMEITAGERGLLAVNELPLEEYLIGLINCEISSQWPMEAIKAQAVIARSYAMYQKDARFAAPYHLEATVMDQVYEGCDIEDSRAARGVKETAGEVLTYNGAIIQAFYHSSCGGHTEASVNVWGFPLPYLRGVDCAYCLKAPNSRWELSLPLAKIETSLKTAGVQATGLRDIRPGQLNASGRLIDLTFVTSRGRSVMTAVNFRKALGYSTIRSTNFDLILTGDDVRFAGTGYGHGVGLCQWGAKQRAADGFDYREILSYYYPGVTLEKVYQ